MAYNECPGGVAAAVNRHTRDSPLRLDLCIITNGVATLWEATQWHTHLPRTPSHIYGS